MLYIYIHTTCPDFNKKIKGVPKSKEKQSGEAKQTPEPDSDRTRMLEWPHRESKITMINMPVTSFEKQVACKNRCVM